MTSLGLFFVGAVLFVNGLSLLGRVDAKGAAPINAFVGALLVGVTAFVVIPIDDLGIEANRDLVLGVMGFLLFAFTYLWAGLNFWTGAGGAGLGWYCAWAAGVSAFLAILNFAKYDDPRFGMLWVLWTILFSLFFCVLGLGMGRLGWATGWVTVIEAFITTTIPGALLLLGEWSTMPDWVPIGVGLASIAVFALLLVRRPPRPADQPILDPDIGTAARA